MPIDDKIKKTVSVDPDTGARTFNMSWSSELKKKEPITRKPVSRETFVTENKPVTKKIVSSNTKESVVKTSGERSFSEVIKPKSAGTTISSDIKASSLPDRKVTPTLTKKEITSMKIDKDNESLKTNYPGMSLEDARAKRYKERVRSAEKSAKENRRFTPVGNAGAPNKSGSGGCTTC